MKNLIIIALLTFTTSAFAQDKDKKNTHIEIATTTVCGMCKETIETEMIYEKGVKSVTVDLDNELILLDYDAKKTDPEKLRLAVTKLGYGADGMPGDEKAFADLPMCCQKEGCGKLKTEKIEKVEATEEKE